MGESGELSIQVEPRGEAVVLSAVGDVDLAQSPELRESIKQALDSNPKKLVVDLGGVNYMDSSGVATLVEALKRAKSGGASLVICSLAPAVLSIFEIARLDQVFNLAGSVDEALSA